MADKENSNVNYNSANTGLNLDNTPNQIQKGKLTYALNSNIENFNSNSVNYQNEEGNDLCVEFPKEYVLVGKHFIPEKTKHLFFLTHPTLGFSEIGYMDNNDCQYKTLINDNCLNFNINHPIHKIVHRITNCSTEIFWPDHNGRRYLDIDNIPYKLKEGSDLINPKYTNELDCNQLKVQPNFNIPNLKVVDTLNGGDLISGTYQFTIQYSDAVGNPYTSFYSITNPTPIADIQIATVNFNYPVGKSIVLDVSNLETSGQFQYYNIAVIKTINNIASVDLVGTYFIENSNNQITYTGQSIDINLAIEDIFEKFPYYEIADDVTSAQDVLIWKGLTSIDRINYQEIASQIKLQWQTYRIPSDENYSNELNATNFRSYLRDEVYAFELVFLLKNGKQTDGFHIPGRQINSNEASLPEIQKSNPDFIEEGESAPHWKIYNTASVSGFSPEYRNTSNYKGPYQYGEFAYWESQEEYPNNTKIWGNLAGKKIRHHKFPDTLISPIIESNIYDGNNFVMGDVATFPIGVKVDINQIKSLINSSSLSQNQKDDIVGFKIVRGDRGTNKSIVAKGILRNVNKYTKENQDYYFPNYPYNDLQEDPFLNATNNAWSQQCEQYTVEVFKLPETDSEGDFIEIEYTDCNINKVTKSKLRTLGKHLICSMKKPKILSIGVVNKVDWNPAPNPPTPAFTTTSTVLIFTTTEEQDLIANVYPNNYDVYTIGRDGNQGLEIGWIDTVTGESSEWFNGAFDGSQPRWRVHVNKGTNPYKIRGNGDAYIELIEEVRVDDCTSSEKLPLLKDNPELAYNQIFNSPETSFGQPFLGDVLKVENLMYGGGKGHFVEVKKNAKYKLLTKEAQQDALESAESIGSITNPFNAAAMFTAYQAYLTIYINGITRKNYAYSYNSIADYNYVKDVPNEGNKQRKINNAKYLVPIVQSVDSQENIIINNYQRETSVFINTDNGDDENPIPALPLPNAISEGIEEKSRLTIGSSGNCANPAQEQDINVLSYYASMKKINRSQWGQIYSYNTVDTGFQIDLDSDISEATIFGGDTFISRFAFKTKLPFFFDNRVGAPDDSDIFYDEIGNVAYPKYWHSARSILADYTVTTGESPVLSNFISYKAHNFDCPNSQELLNEDDEPSTNPDRTFYDGYFYLFSYGVPYFYCESSYNTDLRQAFNNKEGDFYPHIGTGIPDEWLQESNVSIANDNTYNYNVTFSKQNKENKFTHLPFDWEEKNCFTNYPFRAIYSDPQSIDSDNRINNWLIYKALSYYDFPQNYGNLTSLDGIQNKAILARFENKSLLYNSLLTIDTSNPQAAYVGNPKLFANPPIDFAETDLGYAGSQHKFLLRIPQGQVSIDAKRGQVFLIQGSQALDLTGFGSGMNKFFINNLPFNITKKFTNVNIDNHYNGIGLHGVYDSKYNRLIITKLDYSPISNDVKFDGSEFYIERQINDVVLRTQVYLYDENYFCNKSWTVSFNFNTKSWISFHSYIPNFYIADNNFFYSGMNYGCDDEFEALVGTLIPYVPPTTTTTTSSFPLPTTTTTTMAPLDCELSGGTFIQTDCVLEATGIITVPPATTTTICARPARLRSFTLFSGYVISGVGTNSTVSQSSASIGVEVYNDIETTPATMLFFTSGGTSISLGEYLYYNFNSNDCTYVANGWYFTDESAFNLQVFRVENGMIVEIQNVVTTTTTTTTIAPAPICPDRIVVLQICNQNSVKDDNFDIYLNDAYIGAVDLNSNTQVGSIFIASLNQDVSLISSDFSCPLNLMVNYKFESSIILSENVLEMRNTQNNNNGNFGTVGVRSYELIGNDLSNPCVIADLNYSGASGTSFIFNFSYTDCCEPTTTTTTTEPTTTTTTTEPVTTTTTSSSTTTTTTTELTTTTTTTTVVITFDSVLSVIDCSSTEGQGYQINNTNGNVGDILTLNGTATLLSAGTYRLCRDIINIYYNDFTGIPIEDGIIIVDSSGQIISKTTC